MKNYTEAEILALVEANTRPQVVRADGKTYTVPYGAAQEVLMARRAVRMEGQRGTAMRGMQAARKALAEALGVDQTTASRVMKQIR